MQIFSLSGLDPRTKMMIPVCLSTMAMFTSKISWLGLILIVSLFTLVLGGVKFSAALSSIKALLTVLLSLFVIQTLFTRTEAPLLSYHGLVLVTTGGLKLACLLSLRLFILVVSALIMLTGEARDYLLALVQMKVPYEIAFMVMAAIHFIPILREEALNVFYAVQLRGTELKKTNLKRKLKLYLRICLPILVLALNRTRAMATAMEARGFRAKPRRTYMRKLKLQLKDKVLLVILPIIMLSYIMLVNL